jgi:hypothetical protein
MLAASSHAQIVSRTSLSADSSQAHTDARATGGTNELWLLLRRLSALGDRIGDSIGAWSGPLRLGLRSSMMCTPTKRNSHPIPTARSPSVDISTAVARFTACVPESEREREGARGSEREREGARGSEREREGARERKRERARESERERVRARERAAAHLSRRLRAAEVRLSRE